MQTFRTVLPVLLLSQLIDGSGSFWEPDPAREFLSCAVFNFQRARSPFPTYRQSRSYPDCLFRRVRDPIRADEQRRPVSTQARSLTSEKVDVNSAGNPLPFHPRRHSPREPCMLPAEPLLSSPETRAYHTGTAVSMNFSMRLQPSGAGYETTRNPEKFRGQREKPARLNARWPRGARGSRIWPADAHGPRGRRCIPADI